MTDLCLTTVFVGFPGWLQATTVPFPEVGGNLAPLLKMPLSLFFVNKLTPPLSYFCTHELGWRCQDIFAASPTAPLNSLWFHFIPPVSWYFALESWIFGFDLLRSMILLAVPVFEDFKSKSCCICKKNTLKGKFAACVAPQVTLL